MKYQEEIQTYTDGHEHGERERGLKEDNSPAYRTEKREKKETERKNTREKERGSGTGAFAEGREAYVLRDMPWSLWQKARYHFFIVSMRGRCTASCAKKLGDSQTQRVGDSQTQRHTKR